MRIFKTLIVAAFAVATSAGMLLAADDPLEIHGGGRVGFVVNGKGGATRTIADDNELGSMPNYGSSNYMSLSFAKKVTADGGAWAKTFFGFDKWRGTTNGDLSGFTLRLRDFHEEFGGLDFLPAGAVLWGGLRGYGTGWNGQQDHGFIDFNGLGIGVQNIGGIFSLAYFHQTPTDGTDNYADWGQSTNGLGIRVAHNVVASIAVPVADVYAAFGYSKKGKDADEKNNTAAYVAGIFHAPVYGINIGAAFATNNYAREMQFDARSDTFLRADKASPFSGVNADKANKYTGVSLAAWTVTDLAPGLYTATSIGYDYLSAGKETPCATPTLKKNTLNTINASVRISKSLTKNLAFCPTFGYARMWSKENGSKLGGYSYDKDAHQLIQGTAALEMGLDTGYWAGQKLQVYGTFTKTDSKHKFADGAYKGKTSRIDFGTLVSFGF